MPYVLGIKYEVCDASGWSDREVEPSSWASFNDCGKFLQLQEQLIGNVRNIRVCDSGDWDHYRPLDYHISEFFSDPKD